MSAPPTRDLEVVLALLRVCDRQPDLPSFRQTLIEQLEELVACARAVYGEDRRPPAGTEAIELTMPGCETIFLARRHGGFSERDRALIELIRPHLEEAAERALARAARRRLVAALEAAAEAPGTLDPLALCDLGLTPREAEVLVQADRGLTSAEIAEELGVSPRTVHKHLEHAYAKLAVPTRSAALAKARATARGAL